MAKRTDSTYINIEGKMQGLNGSFQVLFGFVKSCYITIKLCILTCLQPVLAIQKHFLSSAIQCMFRNCNAVCRIVSLYHSEVCDNV